MDDRNNDIELPVIELSGDELEIVSGSSEYTSHLNMISQILQMLEQTSKSIIGNIR